MYNIDVLYVVLLHGCLVGISIQDMLIYVVYIIVLYAYVFYCYVITVT